MQVYSTDAVPPRERFAYWRDALTRHFVHLRPEAENRRHFASAIYARTIGGHSCSRVIAGSQRIHRDRTEIAMSPHDLLFINLQVNGRGTFTQNGDETLVAPGDLFIIDATTPFELGCPAPLSQISLKLPRRLFEGGAFRLEQAAGARISGASFTGGLLRDYLTALWRNGEGADADRENAAIEHLVKLTRFEFNRRIRREPAPRGAIRAAQFERALRMIRQNCGERQLTPSRLAERAGVSLRTLQAIFAERGKSIAGQIQEARLVLAQRMLSSPALRQRKIGDIAFACGFAELSHFNHSFARACGSAPGAWRKFRLRD